MADAVVWRSRHGESWCPRQDSNLRTRLRRAMLYPLSYGGRVGSGRWARCSVAASGTLAARHTAPVIVVAGECLVDLIPAADGMLRPVLGGGPFTAARAAGRLGAEVAFLGTLSTDGHGRRARESLADSGVTDRWAPATDDPTTLAAVDLTTGDAARYLFYTGGTSAPALTAADTAPALAAAPAALVVGTLGLVLEPCADTLAALVGQVARDCLVVVDPNCRPAALTGPGAEDRYRERLGHVLGRADVVKVSTEDLDFLSPGVPAAEAARSMAVEHDTLVLLTDGSRGVRVQTPTASVAVDVPRVTVVDTVGAGDSFVGGFVASWTAAGVPAAGLRDLDPAGALLTAVRYGVAVAAVTGTRVGADPPTTAEVRAGAG